MTSPTTGNLRPESLRPPDRRPVVRGFLLDMGMPARLPSNVTVTTDVSASNSNPPPHTPIRARIATASTARGTDLFDIQ